MSSHRIACGALVVCLLAGSTWAGRLPSRNRSREADPIPYNGVNEFALDLYSQLATDKGNAGQNLFFSPFSIHTALGMTYAGARGKTAAAMRRSLHFELPDDAVHPAMGALVDALTRAGGKGGFQLHVANALWGQTGTKILDDFQETNRVHYGAGLERLDLAGDPEGSRGKINSWVAKKTRNTIQDLIPKGLIRPGTSLVLTNAIYFKAKWALQFEESRTEDRPFHLNTGETAQIPTMTENNYYGYWKSENCEALEMHYKGRPTSMVVLLPAKASSLKALEENLTAEALVDILGETRIFKFKVFLPKFKFTTPFRLDKQLAAMGMGIAFLPGKADFSGIDGVEPGNGSLFIQAALHKAMVSVNEEGTEAGGASAILHFKGSPRRGPEEFRVDRPFLFLIWDRTSGTILFMGRVMDPRK